VQGYNRGEYLELQSGHLLTLTTAHIWRCGLEVLWNSGQMDEVGLPETCRPNRDRLGHFPEISFINSDCRRAYLETR
jgi:hypothetical protein